MRAPEPVDTICITGLGMVSALGHDVMNSCAAARAGVSRAGELEYFRIQSSEDGETVNVLGHQVPNATIGFEGFARLLVLSRLALEDLLDNTFLDNIDYCRSGLYLALPDFNRETQGLDLISDDAIRDSRLEEIKSSVEGSNEKNYGVRICRPLTAQLGLSISPSNWFQFYAGHCGVASAIKGAVSNLHDRKIDYAIVGGVDSLIERKTLQWLLDTGRLKTHGMAAGVQPGEAGAFILLERYDTASTRKARIFSLIVDIEETIDEPSLLSGKPAFGIGLSQTIAALVSKNEKAEYCPFWIVTDQNGEPYRACQWGYALTRLLPRIPDMRNATLWYPSMTFGDTGAASGFLGICMVVCGFERGYEVSKTPLILSSSDSGMHSSILITKY